MFQAVANPCNVPFGWATCDLPADHGVIEFEAEGIECDHLGILPGGMVIRLNVRKIKVNPRARF